MHKGGIKKLFYYLFLQTIVIFFNKYRIYLFYSKLIKKIKIKILEVLYINLK